MSYYVKDYEFAIMSRDALAEKVGEYAVGGSDAGHMVAAMEEMVDDYKFFEIPTWGSPNVFIPRTELVSMGALVQSDREPNVVNLYVFKWGPPDNRFRTLYLADDDVKARKIGQHVVKAITLMSRGRKPENPRISPGGPIPNPSD